MHHRSFLSLIVALSLMIPLSTQAYAVTPTTPSEEEVELYYTGAFSVSATIDILDSGEAECWGSVDCYRGYTAEAVMRLQWKSSDGVWLDYTNWSANGVVIDFYETEPIPHGRTYRTKVVADIFDADGNWVEMVTAASGSRYY